MTSKRKRSDTGDEEEGGGTLGGSFRVPQAHWRPGGTLDDPCAGEDEVTIAATFHPKGPSSVDHFRLALGMLSRFNETVRLIFCKPGVACVDLPGIGTEDPEKCDPNAGKLRVVKDRDGVNDLLCAMSMNVEVSVLSADEQSVNVRLASLLKFLRPMDASVSLKVVKYRSRMELNLFWTSDEYPGRRSHVQIGQQFDVQADLSDPNACNPQLDSWNMFSKACAPRPVVSVALSIKELLRLLGSLKPDAEDKKSGNNAFSKGAGCKAAFYVEFLVPEPLPDSSLRQIEFHMGGIFPSDANLTFYEKFLAVESEPAPLGDAPEDEVLRIYRENRLELDLTLHDHHLRATNRPRTTFDVLARQRFSSDLVRSTVEALASIHPIDDKLTLFFGLPAGFDWKTDFANAPHERKRWVEDVPLGLSVESDCVQCWVYVAAQAVTADDED